MISTSVSAFFLLRIAAMNLVILLLGLATFRHVRAGGAYVEEDFDMLLNKPRLARRACSARCSG